MQKQIGPWRSVLLTWRHKLPFWSRRWLATRWRRKAERQAEHCGQVLAKAQALRVAARLIEDGSE